MHNVQTALLPFNLEHKTTQVPEGCTVDEIVKHVFPRKIRGLRTVVTINGDPIPFINWGVVRPKTGTVVCVNIVPTGGGGGKNPLSAILSIAVLIAAPYLAPAIGTSLGLGVLGTGVLTAGQTALFTGIARIGISLVGYLATSMLSSTPKQSSSGSQNLKESTTQYIEGASNAIDRFGVIPVNLGTNRMYPKQAALPYTETSSNVQYARQLFTYGYGKQIISDRKIGETLISRYTEVEMEDKLNGDLNTGTSLYSKDVFQETFSIKLEPYGSPTVLTTQENSNECDIDFNFPQGLVRYNDKGKRTARQLGLRVYFAPVGTTDYSIISARTKSSQSVARPTYTRPTTGLIILNKFTGDLALIETTVLPYYAVRIGSWSWALVSGTPTFSILDERASSVAGGLIVAGGFAPSIVGSNVETTSGTINLNDYYPTASTAESFNVSYRITFPSTGQYDVYVQNLSPPTSDDKIREDVVLSSLKSIKNTAPVNQANISGTAMRIRATDQLNGTVQQYNVIASTFLKYYDSDLDAWVDGVSSNCAAIYRYVLQSEAFIKRIGDSGINLEKLQEWSIYCDENNLTYNRVIDYETSIDDVLNDICAAGMATIHKPSGIYSVIIDNERPEIKGMITPRNSWGYKGNINYPELPDALRVRFRDKANGYLIDERIVYNTDFDESNAEEYETLEFNSCTDSDLAYFYGNRYLRTGALQPETHSFNVDFENLTFDRGDRIVLVNDAILVGVGQGRIRTLIDNGTHVTGFTIDDTVSIPTTNQFGVRIRNGDGSGFDYHLLTTVVGETDTFTFQAPILIANAPVLESLCAFVEDGKELDLIITDIKPNNDQNAQVMAVNYAPERFTSLGPIPAFTSNITTPLDFIRPEAPILISIQSDEDVMSVNPDGTYFERMVLKLRNVNGGQIESRIKLRRKGDTEFYKPDILEISAEKIVMTGFDTGIYYDMEIVYKRLTTDLYSLPLVINSYKFEGTEGLPSNVENFKLTTATDTAFFSWNPVEDIDVSHYKIKYSNLYTGATWDTSQALFDRVYETTLSIPFIGGTYFIKAVDLSGNESATATAILTFNSDGLLNAVEVLTENPSFAGVKDNVILSGTNIQLEDVDVPLGYYYFDNIPDLTEIYSSFVSAGIVSGGAYFNNIFIYDDIFEEEDVFGAGGNDIFAYDDLFALDDVFGIGLNGWSVSLEFSTTNDDPGGSPVWSAWQSFTAGTYEFRSIRFRLKLESTQYGITPSVSALSVTIDMPDRVERGEDLTCPVSGYVHTYTPKFKKNPSVVIQLQEYDPADIIEFVSKTSWGFEIKVYNTTSASYVERTFDFIASGYGREI